MISYYGMFSVLIWLAMIKADMAGMNIIWGRRKCLSIWWRSWPECCRRKSWSCAWPWIHSSVTWILRDHSKSRIKVSVSHRITRLLSRLSSGWGTLILNSAYLERCQISYCFSDVRHSFMYTDIFPHLYQACQLHFLCFKFFLSICPLRITDSKSLIIRRKVQSDARARQLQMVAVS